MTHFRGLSAVQVYICKNGKYMQPTISEALGDCHSALRRGIQKTSKTTNGAGCIHCTASGCGMTTASERGMTNTDNLACGMMYT